MDEAKLRLKSVGLFVYNVMTLSPPAAADYHAPSEQLKTPFFPFDQFGWKFHRYLAAGEQFST